MARRPTTLIDRLTRRGPLARGRRFFMRGLWMIDVRKLSWPAGKLVRTLRIAAITVRGTMRDELKKHAQALTYITVFSMIPLLAFGFAIAKGFGAYDTSQEQAITLFLDNLFGTLDSGAVDVLSQSGKLGDKDIEITLPGETPVAERTDADAGVLAVDGLEPESDPLEDRAGVDETDETEVPAANATPDPAATAISLREGIYWVRQRAEGANLQTLGVFGLLFLLYATIRMLGALEASLNEIWGIQRERTFVRKVTDYTAIMVVTPVIVIGGTVWMQQGMFQGDNILLSALPLLVTSLGMAFALFTFPNGPVNPLSAIIGGLVAGAGWQLVLFLIVRGQIGLARLEGLYATFAAIPMLLLFFYFSWWMLLFGAEAAYAHQTEPVFTSIARTGAVDQAWRESLAPRLAGRIAFAFIEGTKPPTASELAADLGVPPRHVRGVLDELVVRDILARINGEEDEEAFLPSRDPSTITVLDLVEALRHDGEINILPTPTGLDRRVDQMMARLRGEARGSEFNLSMSELAGVLAEERAGVLPVVAANADDATSGLTLT